MTDTPPDVELVEVPARKPDFTWHGRPVYRCRFCRFYERVDNLEAVEAHEREAHGPVTRTRTTGLVDASGAPILIEEREERSE